MTRAGVLAAVLFAGLGPAAAFACSGFTTQQMDYLTNTDPKKNNGVLGAEAKAQFFYHYFKRDRDPTVTPPQWVDQNLDAMLQRPVWRDPEEGILSEAQLWQAPLSVLYEFFEHTRKTFPPERGGMCASPGALIHDYEDSRTRFQMALDRLYRARLGDSLQGRGRAVLSDFQLTLKEMNSLLDALSSQNRKSYTSTVMAIGALTNDAYRVLHQAPRGYSPPGQNTPAQTGAPLALKLLGTMLMFASLWSLGVINEAKISQEVDNYWERSRVWAYEFNRQFLQIKVQYLVMAPIGAGLLFGMMTFNPIGFVMFTAAGIYVGLNTPMWMLTFIRIRRGKRVEAQLMEALILLSNALKSGLDIVQGFGMVSRDLIPPISEEFGLVIKNYQLGTPFEKALEGMEDRITSRLLSYVIKAISIQRSVGGNLTKIFDRIVDNIREEGKLEEKMQALTAQQRIQSIVVGIMPWCMVILMFIFQYETMAKYYFSPIGILTILFCVLWMSIGMGIVRKLADVQV
ncbi:MAG: type II secretion system F family protein [Proteobacteria bacterium]|nr:type II secretion system F family protein [Pseudomonadota bacterium]